MEKVITLFAMLEAILRRSDRLGRADEYTGVIKMTPRYQGFHDSAN